MDALSKLFGSPARLKLLRLFFFNDDSAFTARDAALRARVGKEATQKELAHLVGAGVVKRRAASGGNLYSTNKAFVHYEPLKAFLRTTTNVRDTDIASGLRKAGNVRLAVLSGLFTGVPESKVDLLIVGDRLGERELVQVVRTLEAELGRELRYASFSTDEYRYRVGVYDRLIRDVFDYPNRTILDRMSAS